MKRGWSIGEVARITTLPVQTIRFYEEEGIIPPLARTGSGYRVFTASDVRRLRLAGKARMLGMGVSEIRALLDKAFASDCADLADQLLALVAEQQAEIDQRIEGLMSLRRDLAALEQHVRHSRQSLEPGQAVAHCEFCPIIDKEGGDT